MAPGVTANNLTKWNYFTNILRAVEVFAVVITLVFLIQQTNVLVQQTQESVLSNKMQVANYMREHYQTINKILADNKDARKEFDLSIGQVMAYMLLAEYDNIYQMFEEGMIDRKKWKILEPFINKQMRHRNPPIKDVWRNPVDRGPRSPGFEEYVEACVYSDLYDFSSMNKDVDMAAPAKTSEVEKAVGMQEGGKLHSSLTSEERDDFRERVCPNDTPLGTLPAGP